MALSFQNKKDELDEAVKEERRGMAWVSLVGFVVITAIMGVWAWIRGESLHSYGLDISWLFVAVFITWLVGTLHEEFRIRTNGIYGKLKEIEDRLGAIERELSSLRYEK